jgi:hypothetical protein
MTAWGTAGLLALAALGKAGEIERDGIKRLEVRVENAGLVPVAVRALGQMTASRIFAGIAVRIVWQGERTPAGGKAFRVNFRIDTPNGFLPGALGYTTPFAKTGPQINILYDRVVATNVRSRLGFVLGHVIAHELAHAIERCDCHAPDGVLKSHWQPRDLTNMEMGPLGFTPFDAAMIRKELPTLQ